jgi:hypothetical protein
VRGWSTMTKTARSFGRRGRSIRALGPLPGRRGESRSRRSGPRSSCRPLVGVFAPMGRQVPFRPGGRSAGNSWDGTPRWGRSRRLSRLGRSGRCSSRRPSFGSFPRSMATHPLPGRRTNRNEFVGRNPPLEAKNRIEPAAGRRSPGRRGPGRPGRRPRPIAAPLNSCPWSEEVDASASTSNDEGAARTPSVPCGLGLARSRTIGAGAGHVDPRGPPVRGPSRRDRMAAASIDGDGRFRD